MTSESLARNFQYLIPDIVELWVLQEGNTLQKLIKIMCTRFPKLEKRPRVWKRQLDEWGIRKNLRRSDVETFLSWIRAERLPLDQCLFVSNGILMDVHDIEKYIQDRTDIASATDSSHQRVGLVFVRLPMRFRFTNMEFFRSFRRLLWYTKNYFDFCFFSGIWTMDEGGMYGRSEVLRYGLSILSRLHNLTCDALNHRRLGNSTRWQAIVLTVADLQESVVVTHHHRQFPDLFAIMLLLERNGLSDLRTVMAENWYEWATSSLPDNGLPNNSHRRKIFQLMRQIPVDLEGHSYIAFDAFCRHTWTDKVSGSDIIKSYFSYNQASLPRTTPGEFYSLYQNKTTQDICDILDQVDQRFDSIDHARICLWHTAIRYLIYERQQYVSAENICCKLIPSLDLPSRQSFQPNAAQRNIDTALTHFLLGTSQIGMGKSSDALQSFKTCADIRREIVRAGVWDPTLAGALQEMICLANWDSDAQLASECKNWLDVMYSTLEETTRDQTSIGSRSNLLSDKIKSKFVTNFLGLT